MRLMRGRGFSRAVRAILGGAALQGSIWVSFIVSGFSRRGLDGLQPKRIKRRRLPRDPVMIHRVWPVCPDLHFEDVIRALAGNALDRDANSSQVFGEAAVVHRQINELAQPS